MTTPTPLLPLKLCAEPGVWRLYHARNQHSKFAPIRDKVFERDQYTCRYCGFLSQKYQTIINIDHNYKNNNIDNLTTACSFCAQCFFIESIGLDGNSGGKLVHLPEMSQAELNQFSRILYCAMDKDSAYKAKLQAVALSFSDRAHDIVACFGVDCDNPKIFGQTLIDAQITKIQQEHEVLKSIRLLASKKDFKQQIEYWKNTIFAKIPL